MNNRHLAFGLCLVLLFSSASLLAQGTALTLKASSLGIGLEVTRSITPKLNARIGASFMNLTYSGETQGSEPMAYDLDLKLQAYTALVDYYPFNFGMRFSGGFIYNAMNLEGSGRAVDDYTFDGQVFTPEDIGVLTIKTEPSAKFAPYLGIGFGNAVSANKKVGLILDIGILYMGSPDVTLEADTNSMIYPTTSQEADVEEDLQNLKWYPYINFGISYKF